MLREISYMFLNIIKLCSRFVEGLCVLKKKNTKFGDHLVIFDEQLLFFFLEIMNFFNLIIVFFNY